MPIKNNQYVSRHDICYVPMEKFIKDMQKQTEFSYYCDLLYIDKCEGEFPDLHEFKCARRIFITNCKIKVYTHTHPIPPWIESLSIECTEINELPRLPMNLRRIYISRTSLEILPDYLPSNLFEFILEDAPYIDRLPPLPTKLNKFVCVNTPVTVLPPLPNHLYILYCWNNELTRLPEIPRNLMYLRCAGNPFSEMPWINLLHEKGSTLSQIQIDRTDLEIVLRFREIYYAVRLRERFKRWLWRPRERDAKELFHPIRLAEFVEDVHPENLESALDLFFSMRSTGRSTNRSTGRK